MKNEFCINGTTIWRYTMPALYSNMYLVLQESDALAIDPCISDAALKYMQASNIRKVTVLLTHEHFDHISGVNWLRENFSVEVVCSQTCAQMLVSPVSNLAKFWRAMLMDKSPEERQAGIALEDPEYVCAADTTFVQELCFDWHGHHLKMVEAPGHSPGGSLIFFDEALLSGDNLVNGAGVIYRLPNGSKRQYLQKTRPLLEALPDHTFVLPGHGDPGSLAELRCYMEPFGKVPAKSETGLLSEGEKRDVR